VHIVSCVWVVNVFGGEGRRGGGGSRGGGRERKGGEEWGRAYMGHFKEQRHERSLRHTRPPSLSSSVLSSTRSMIAFRRRRCSVAVAGAAATAAAVAPLEVVFELLFPSPRLSSSSLLLPPPFNPWWRRRRARLASPASGPRAPSISTAGGSS
jgi:hypothetical protein